MYTLAIPVMLGMVGMSANVGWMYFREQAAQAAAESAALAGVQAAVASSPGGIVCGTNRVVCQSATACLSTLPSSPADNLESACMYAKDNGFERATTNQNVLLAANTTSTPITGIKTGYWVSATVVESVPTGFLSIMGQSKTTVSKRATAAVVGAIQGACVYVLDPSAQNALVVTGNGNLQSACGVYVKSTNTKALQVTGNGTLVTGSGGLNLSGGDQGSNAVGANASCTKCIYPAPTTVSSVSDPLASVAPPTVGGCDHTNATYGSGATPTLNPGVYCGGITMSANANVTLNPGVYILNGGGLTVSSSQAQLSGTGVMFYVSGDASHSYGAVNITGQATLNLSAPTSGTYNNILFFQDRSQGSSSTQNTFAGGSTVNVSGVLYFPTQKLIYSGGSGTDLPSVGIVADLLEITGNAYVQNGLSANGGTGSKVAVIE